MHWDFPRGINPQPNFVAAHFDDSDHNRITDPNAFIGFSGQDEHGYLPPFTGRQLSDSRCEAGKNRRNRPLAAPLTRSQATAADRDGQPATPKNVPFEHIPGNLAVILRIQLQRNRMPQQSANSEFLDTLSLGIRELHLSTDRVLVAVSGGADSVALLRGLHALSKDLQLTCVAGHINHGLRGDESDQDAVWVAELAKRLSIEGHVRDVDLTSAASSGESLEETARNRRYELLTEIAVETNCGAVAVAHTADDQTETVLHHLIRGTGIAGLAGIPKSRSLSAEVRLIRPLLDVRRDGVERWLSEIGQDYRTDTTNEDRRFTRNRIRHDLLPLLEQQFNPAFRQVLASLSEQAAETSDFMRRLAEELADGVVQSTSADTIRIDCQPLQSVDRVLIREVLRVIWNRAGWPLKRMGFQEWQRLADLTHAGVALNLPGRIDARRRGTLLILSNPSTSAERQTNDE